MPGSRIAGEHMAVGGSGQEGKTHGASPSLSFLSQPLQFERDRKCRGSKAGVSGRGWKAARRPAPPPRWERGVWEAEGEAAGGGGRAGRTEEKAGGAPEDPGGRGAEEEAGGGWEKSQRGGKHKRWSIGLFLDLFLFSCCYHSTSTGLALADNSLQQCLHRHF